MSSNDKTSEVKSESDQETTTIVGTLAAVTDAVVSAMDDDDDFDDDIVGEILVPSSDASGPIAKVETLTAKVHNPDDALKLSDEEKQALKDLKESCTDKMYDLRDLIKQYNKEVREKGRDLIKQMRTAVEDLCKEADKVDLLAEEIADRVADVGGGKTFRLRAEKWMGELQRDTPLVTIEGLPDLEKLVMPVVPNNEYDVRCKLEFPEEAPEKEEVDLIEDAKKALRDSGDKRKKRFLSDQLYRTKTYSSSSYGSSYKGGSHYHGSHYSGSGYNGGHSKK